jgi:hypothetical protein
LIQFFSAAGARGSHVSGGHGPPQGWTVGVYRFNEIQQALLNYIPRSGGVGDGKEKLWIYANFKYKIKSMIFIPYTKNGA